MIVIVIVSLITGGADKDVEKEFDDVNAMVKENKEFN